MSSFTAINIEPEEDTQEEIDDSKEIQIEEALRSYQNALKLHSQGPEFYPAAKAAYDTLFQSEIFTYPESLSLSKQIDLYGDLEDFIDAGESVPQDSAILQAASAEEAPNTLHQILFLAYKNQGQYLLDSLKDYLSRAELKYRTRAELLDSEEVRGTVLASLDALVNAADRDEADLQLWRLISKLGLFLGSKRLARYCLEAVLDDEDVDADDSYNDLGLEESFAAEQLHSLIQNLNDEVSEAQNSSFSGKKSSLISSLRKHVDPCPFLPTPLGEIADKVTPGTQDIPVSKQTITSAMRTWVSVGKAILLQAGNIAQGTADPAFGTAYTITLPDATRPIREPVPLQIPTSAELTTSAMVSAKGIADQPSSTKTADESGTIVSPVSASNGNNCNIGSASIKATDVDPKKGTERSDNGALQSINEQIQSESQEQEVMVDSTGGLVDSPILESPRTMSLPTRKRSSEAAGLAEPTDVGRSKSKRIKARVSAPEATNEDLTRYYDEQLRDHILADQMLFEFVGTILTKLKANNLTNHDELKRALMAPTTALNHSIDSVPGIAIAIQDMKSTLTSWNQEMSGAFMKQGDGENDFGGANGARNFTAFLESSKRGPRNHSDMPSMPEDEGLEHFVADVNEDWTNLDQLAFKWIRGLLGPKSRDTNIGDVAASAYETLVWTPSLKETVVRVLVEKDEFIYNTLLEEVHDLDGRFMALDDTLNAQYWRYEEERMVNLVQNIFELHLDVYEQITKPSSEVSLDVRALQKHRLRRWATLTYNAISKRSQLSPRNDGLRIRFLWSSVLHVNLTDATARDHVVLCFQDLKQSLRSGPTQVLKLPNNAAMPEISVEAADREISSLTTMDFFLGIFNSEDNEPLAVIESLEPILQRSVIETTPSTAQSSDREGLLSTALSPHGSPHQNADSNYEAPMSSTRMDEMVQYLNKASLTLRLFLWQRLAKAYEAIQYLPQVVLCNLRRIGLILEHLQTQSYIDQPSNMRQLSLLTWLNTLEQLISQSLTLTVTQSNAFEIVDVFQLRSSIAAVSALQGVTHLYVLWRDSVQVGQHAITQPLRGSAATGFAHSMAKLEQMQVKAWTLQFILIKEATLQVPELFEAPKQDLADYLNYLHYSLGLRQLCGLCDKSFLRLVKTELQQYKAYESWEYDYAQIIFDLYGLKICPSFTNIQSHGCPPEPVERNTALDLLDYVLIQANRMNIRDLAKSELKFTIERLHVAIKAPKASNAGSLNKRAINHFLKTPINPLDIYRAFQGIGELSSIPINNEFTGIADRGWFSLLGQMALAKFRAQKKTIPGPLDDIDLAITNFRHDLELGIEKWETWYRLAQVYDAKLEEYTTWAADKINNAMEELKQIQRYAINCYTMAVATAARSADASFETVSKISDMYSDFAVRIYSSSREPFSMKAFSLQDFEKHCSNPSQGMFKKRPFRELQLYPAWDLTRYLLQRALTNKRDWTGCYVLTKCLWKMYSCSDDIRGKAKRLEYQDVLHAATRAIETIPDRRDTRHPEKEPVLEPHYKIVSIVHKLVQRRQIQAAEACSYLKATPYAHKVPPVEESEEWDMYISQVLKALRSADKANWHHRMAARAAHIIYDESPDDIRSALGAKHELTQQIFTKTMSIQVWRPDNERAGRHFVYTSRYAKFFVRLLFQLNDRASFESLTKRIRKRPGDFLAHGDLWQEICLTYLELLRRQAPQAPVPREHENLIFKAVPHEIFAANADRLEDWAQLPETSSPLLDIIKETIDLRKTNLNLMKASIIEDLIGDTYALLYEQVMPELIAKSNDEENRVRMRVDHLLMASEPSATATPPPDPIAPVRPDEMPAARPRFKGVTRREVQKRAEALVAKPAAVLAAAKAPKLSEQTDGNQSPLNPATLAIKDEANKEVVSSAPGSVHDDADDESELSELEEFVDAPEKPVAMFPNLGGKGDEDDRDGEDRQDDDEEMDEEGLVADVAADKDVDDDEEEDEGEEAFKSPEQTNGGSEAAAEGADGGARNGDVQPMDLEANDTRA